jgi:predicted esterase
VTVSGPVSVFWYDLAAEVKEHRLKTTRSARYYTLGGVDGRASEVWIVIHGFAQLASHFVRAFEGIASPGRLVVAPEALNRFYVEPGSGGSRPDARVGATWMTREDRENEIADYVEFLDSVYARVVRPGDAVTALGYSQGVATATRWAALGGYHPARLILWAGQVPPELDLNLLARRLSSGVVLVEGRLDEYSTWVQGDDNLTRLQSAGVTAERIQFDGGHRIDADVLMRLARA